ncbi:MAG TPA: diguanylate cyclase [Desulfurococcales archaeon]|nr:diguanylate cyclase [Desulfurococcales archaeon]
MVDLTVEFCGLKFRNPVLTAAGPPVRDSIRIKKCIEGGAGGIVTKTISVKAADPYIPRPHMAEVRGAFLNTELWSELPPEEWFNKHLREARVATKAAGIPLIVSLGYTADEISKLIPEVENYVDGIELSVHYIGVDPKPMQDSIRAAKKSGLPVFLKLSPHPGVDPVLWAKKAIEAGADGISAINSFGPVLALDLSTSIPIERVKGLPVMGGDKGYGWLSGPPLRYLAQRIIFEIAKALPNIPIIGVGGVSCGRDAVEMLMVGAWAVGVCTAAILYGPQIYGKIAKEIAEILDKLGFKSVEDVRGYTIKNWSKRWIRFKSTPPKLYTDRCNGCKLCELSCPYDAIKVINGKAKLFTEKCFGCGLCVSRCRQGALEMPL